MRRTSSQRANTSLIDAYSPQATRSAPGGSRSTSPTWRVSPRMRQPTCLSLSLLVRVDHTHLSCKLSIEPNHRACISPTHSGRSTNDQRRRVSPTKARRTRSRTSALRRSAPSCCPSSIHSSRATTSTSLSRISRPMISRGCVSLRARALVGASNPSTTHSHALSLCGVLANECSCRSSTSHPMHHASSARRAVLLYAPIHSSIHSLSHTPHLSLLLVIV